MWCEERQKMEGGGAWGRQRERGTTWGQKEEAGVNRWIDPGLGRGAVAYSPTFAVPSARRGLTSLFGMGRGGTPVLLPP